MFSFKKFHLLYMDSSFSILFRVATLGVNRCSLASFLLLNFPTFFFGISLISTFMIMV